MAKKISRQRQNYRIVILVDAMPTQYKDEIADNETLFSCELKQAIEHNMWSDSVQVKKISFEKQ